MKRIILSAIVMAFAVAVQAGDAKTSQAKEQPSCCSSKVKTSLETKEGTCPISKCGGCKQKAAKQTTKAVAVKSPKDGSKG